MLLQGCFFTQQNYAALCNRIAVLFMQKSTATRKHIVETLDLVLQALYHGLDTLSIRIGIIPFIEHILIPGCLRQFKQFVCSKVRQLALSKPLCAPLVPSWALSCAVL